MYVPPSVWWLSVASRCKHAGIIISFASRITAVDERSVRDVQYLPTSAHHIYEGCPKMPYN